MANTLDAIVCCPVFAGLAPEALAAIAARGAVHRLERYPGIAAVFVRRGMACVGCDMARFDTILDAARVYQQAPADLAAELWFIETLVRLHREGEGAPSTGLKPAGTVEPGVAAADRALAAGDANALVAALAGAVGDAVRVRLDRVVAAREHADHTVAGGRAYVAAYVDYVHFVEGLHTSLGSTQHGTLAGNQQTHTH